MPVSHTLHGCVDRNTQAQPVEQPVQGHTLHGCVDRNSNLQYGIYTALAVTPFTGVWIEIDWNKTNNEDLPVTPFTGVWIEIFGQAKIDGACLVTPFTGVWIEISVLDG